MRKAKPLTADGFRNHLTEQGMTLKQWAEQNGYSPNYCSKILNGHASMDIGIGHEIAVSMGIKASSTKNPLPIDSFVLDLQQDSEGDTEQGDHQIKVDRLDTDAYSLVIDTNCQKLAVKANKNQFIAIMQQLACQLDFKLVPIGSD